MTSQMMPPQGQLPLEEPTQFSKPSDGYEGPEEGGISFDQPELPPEEMEQEIIGRLSELSDENKELLALYLTPEFANIMGEFLGPVYGSAFMKLADPTKILVPVNREKVLGQGAPSEMASNEGATPPQQGMDTPQTATSF